MIKTNGLTPKETNTPGGGPVITKQDEKDGADINKILANFRRTGELSNISTKPPQFGDFTQAQSFEDALTVVKQTEQAFATWPAAVRDAADNDPHTALEMLADEGGRAILEAAGMPPVNPRTPETQPTVPATPAPATPS